MREQGSDRNLHGNLYVYEHKNWLPTVIKVILALLVLFAFIAALTEH